MFSSLLNSLLLVSEVEYQQVLKSDNNKDFTLKVQIDESGKVFYNIPTTVTNETLDNPDSEYYLYNSPEQGSCNFNNEEWAIISTHEIPIYKVENNEVVYTGDSNFYKVCLNYEGNYFRSKNKVNY